MTDAEHHDPLSGRAFWLSAPAKLNLTLHVVGRRPDGFHNLRSLVCGIDLCDRLRGRAATDGKIALLCNDARLPDEPNLVRRAVEALRAETGCRTGLSVRLDKRIPIGAGLGGGSSDAAAALRLAARAWGLSVSDEALSGIGARIGSDVPLFFALPSAVITGRGEHVEPVRLAWAGAFLLIHGDRHVSTAEVYGVFRRHPCRRPPPDRTEEAIRARTAAELTPCLHNDLEEAVYLLHPALMALKEEAQRVIGRRLVLTGAGSTWFAPVDHDEEGAMLAERIRHVKLGVRAEVVRGLISAPAVEERG